MAVCEYCGGPGRLIGGCGIPIDEGGAFILQGGMPDGGAPKLVGGGRIPRLVGGAPIPG